MKQIYRNIRWWGCIIAFGLLCLVFDHSVKRLVQENPSNWEEINSKCRDALNDEDAKRLCQERDNLEAQFKKKGFDNKNEELELITETLTEDKLFRALNSCLIHSIAKHDSVNVTQESCLKVGILWCNKAGLKTSINARKSTHGIYTILDNSACADNLNTRYKVIADQYYSELENFLHYEQFNLPYKPILFDIRKIVRTSP